jgi:tetratricopeptide (TPR) repeat protein
MFAMFVLAVSPADFSDIAARAAAAREANNGSQAIALYQQAVQLNPQWAEGWWYLGNLSADAGRFAECRDALLQFVRLEDKQAQGWSTLGLCEFETGDYAASLEHIRHALTLGSGIPADMMDVLRFHEALILTREGQFDLALRSYSAIVRGGPRSETFVAGLGLAALHKPLLPNDIPPAEQDLYRIAGTAMGKSMVGDNDGAQAEFRDLLARYPSNPDVQYLYGAWLLPQHPDDGIKQLESLLDSNPQRDDVRAMIAYNLVQRGDLNRALPFAKKAAEDAPGNPLAQYVYGRALAGTGDLQTGIAHLEAAAKLDPSSLDCHVALASAYSRAGRPVDSRRERMKSIALARASGAGS